MNSNCKKAIRKNKDQLILYKKNVSLHQKESQSSFMEMIFLVLAHADTHSLYL